MTSKQLGMLSLVKISQVITNFCNSLKKPLRTLHKIDCRQDLTDKLTHISYFNLTIKDHMEEAPFLVTKLGPHYPLFMSIPRIQHHEPTHHFSTNTVTVDCSFCQQHSTSSCNLTEAEEIAIDIPQPTPLSVITGATAFMSITK